MSPGPNDTNRLRILQAARKLFASQGFEGTTVRQICVEASVNVAMVSYYFGGKDKMFEAIFEEWFPHFTSEEYQEQIKDPHQGLCRMVREIASFTIAQRELSQIVEQEIFMDSARSKVVHGYILPVWMTFKDLLAEGKEKGIFHFDSLSQTLLMVHSVVLAHKRSRLLQDLVIGPSPLEDQTQFPEAALGFLLRALGAPGPDGSEE